MRFLKNKGCILIVLVLLVSMIAGCAKETPQSKEVVVTIDGQDVYKDEVLMYALSLKQEFEYLGGGEDIWDTDFDGQTAEELAKETLLDRIVRIKIVLKKAGEMNLSLTDEEKTTVKNDVSSYLQYLTDEEKKLIGVNETMAERVFNETTLGSKVFEEVTKDFEADQAAIDKAVDENATVIYYKQADWNEELKKVTAKHILIKTFTEDESGTRTDFTEEEKASALEKAEGVLALAKAGDDFADLVQEYSEDTVSLAADGEMTFTRGEMVTEFENAAFALDNGEISDIVTTSYGYHIIKMENNNVPPTQAELDELQQTFDSFVEDLRTQYEDDQKKEAFEKTYQDWKANISVAVNDEVWNAIIVGKQPNIEAE